MNREAFLELVMPFKGEPARRIRLKVITLINMAEEALKSKGAILIHDMDAEQIFQIAVEKARKERMERDQAVANEKATREKAAKLITQERAQQERTNRQWRDEMMKLGRKAMWLANNLVSQSQQEEFDLRVIQGGKQHGNIAEWFGERYSPTSYPGIDLKGSDLYEDYCSWCAGRNQTPRRVEVFEAFLVDELGVSRYRKGDEQFFAGLAKKHKKEGGAA